MERLLLPSLSPRRQHQQRRDATAASCSFFRYPLTCCFHLLLLWIVCLSTMPSLLHQHPHPYSVFVVAQELAQQDVELLGATFTSVVTVRLRATTPITQHCTLTVTSSIFRSNLDAYCETSCKFGCRALLKGSSFEAAVSINFDTVAFVSTTPHQLDLARPFDRVQAMRGASWYSIDGEDTSTEGQDVSRQFFIFEGNTIRKTVLVKGQASALAAAVSGVNNATIRVRRNLGIQTSSPMIHFHQTFFVNSLVQLEHNTIVSDPTSRTTMSNREAIVFYQCRVGAGSQIFVRNNSIDYTNLPLTAASSGTARGIRVEGTSFVDAQTTFLVLHNTITLTQNGYTNAVLFLDSMFYEGSMFNVSHLHAFDANYPFRSSIKGATSSQAYALMTTSVANARIGEFLEHSDTNMVIQLVGINLENTGILQLRHFQSWGSGMRLQFEKRCGGASDGVVTSSSPLRILQQKGFHFHIQNISLNSGGIWAYSLDCSATISVRDSKFLALKGVGGQHPFFISDAKLNRFVVDNCYFGNDEYASPLAVALYFSLVIFTALPTADNNYSSSVGMTPALLSVSNSVFESRNVKVAAIGAIASGIHFINVVAADNSSFRFSNLTIYVEPVVSNAALSLDFQPLGPNVSLQMDRLFVTMPDMPERLVRSNRWGVSCDSTGNFGIQPGEELLSDSVIIGGSVSLQGMYFHQGLRMRNLTVLRPYADLRIEGVSTSWEIAERRFRDAVDAPSMANQLQTLLAAQSHDGGIYSRAAEKVSGVVLITDCRFEAPIVLRGADTAGLVNGLIFRRNAVEASQTNASTTGLGLATFQNFQLRNGTLDVSHNTLLCALVARSQRYGYWFAGIVLDNCGGRDNNLPCRVSDSTLVMLKDPEKPTLTNDFAVIAGVLFDMMQLKASNFSGLSTPEVAATTPFFANRGLRIERINFNLQPRTKAVHGVRFTRCTQLAASATNKASAPTISITHVEMNWPDGWIAQTSAAVSNQQCINLLFDELLSHSLIRNADISLELAGVGTMQNLTANRCYVSFDFDLDATCVPSQGAGLPSSAWSGGVSVRRRPLTIVDSRLFNSSAIYVKDASCGFSFLRSTVTTETAVLMKPALYLLLGKLQGDDAIYIGHSTITVGSTITFYNQEALQISSYELRDNSSVCIHHSTVEATILGEPSNDPKYVLVALLLSKLQLKEWSRIHIRHITVRSFRPQAFVDGLDGKRARGLFLQRVQFLDNTSFDVEHADIHVRGDDRQAICLEGGTTEPLQSRFALLRHVWVHNGSVSFDGLPVAFTRVQNVTLVDGDFSLYVRDVNSCFQGEYSNFALTRQEQSQPDLGFRILSNIRIFNGIFYQKSYSGAACPTVVMSNLSFLSTRPQRNFATLATILTMVVPEHGTFLLSHVRCSFLHAFASIGLSLQQFGGSVTSRIFLLNVTSEIIGRPDVALVSGNDLRALRYQARAVGTSPVAPIVFQDCNFSVVGAIPMAVAIMGGAFSEAPAFVFRNTHFVARNFPVSMAVDGTSGKPYAQSSPTALNLISGGGSLLLFNRTVAIGSFILGALVPTAVLSTTLIGTGLKNGADFLGRQAPSIFYNSTLDGIPFVAPLAGVVGQNASDFVTVMPQCQATVQCSTTTALCFQTTKSKVAEGKLNGTQCDCYCEGSRYVDEPRWWYEENHPVEAMQLRNLLNTAQFNLWNLSDIPMACEHSTSPTEAPPMLVPAPPVSVTRTLTLLNVSANETTLTTTNPPSSVSLDGTELTTATVIASTPLQSSNNTSISSTAPATPHASALSHSSVSVTRSQLLLDTSTNNTSNETTTPQHQVGVVPKDGRSTNSASEDIVIAGLGGSENAASTIAIGTATSAAFASALSPVAATRALRVGAIAGVAACALGDDDATSNDDSRPPLIELPFPVAVGASALRYFVGATLIATVLLVAIALLHAVLLMSVRKRAAGGEEAPSDEPRHEAKEEVKPPMDRRLMQSGTSLALSLWFAYFLPSVAAYSLMLAVDPAARGDGASRVIGAVQTLFVFAAFVLVCFVITLRLPNLLDFKIWHNHRGVLKVRYANKPGSLGGPAETLLVLVDAARDPNSILSRSYFVIDVGATTIVAILQALQPTPSWCLYASGIVGIVALLLLVYLLFVRPYRTRIETVFAITNATLQAVLAVAAIVATSAPPKSLHTQKALTVMGYMLVLQFAVFAAQPIVQGGWILYRMKKRWDRGEGDDAADGEEEEGRISDDKNWMDGEGQELREMTASLGVASKTAARDGTSHSDSSLGDAKARRATTDEDLVVLTVPDRNRNPSSGERKSSAASAHHGEYDGEGGGRHRRAPTPESEEKNASSALGAALLMSHGSVGEGRSAPRNPLRQSKTA